MSPTTVQITMTAADPGDPARGRYVTVALPRDARAGSGDRGRHGDTARCFDGDRRGQKSGSALSCD
jgi:hypothetical protein